MSSNPEFISPGARQLNSLGISTSMSRHRERHGHVATKHPVLGHAVAILNLVGAFLSVEVAITVTNAVIRIQNPDGTLIPEVMGDGGGVAADPDTTWAGAIIWNILTWLWGLPSALPRSVRRPGSARPSPAPASAA